MTEPGLGTSLGTPYKLAYGRVKAAAIDRTRQMFANLVGSDVAAIALEWTPEYVEAQASVLGTVVEAAQMMVGNLTSVDMSRKLDAKPTSVERAITLRDTGITKAQEYQRPFWEVTKAARNEKSDPLQDGLTRLRVLTDTDLQMAKVRQAQLALRAAGRQTYRRVTTSDNPCALCEIAATQVYYTEDLLAIHPNCECEVESDDVDQEQLDAGFSGIGDTGDQKKAIGALNENDAPPIDYRKLIAVRDHGEVGPMLTWDNQHFQGAHDLSNLEASKQRQLASMRRQLSRGIEHQGTVDFRSFYTTAQRDKLLEKAETQVKRTKVQATQAVEAARANAPAHLDEVNQRAVQRVAATYHAGGQHVYDIIREKGGITIDLGGHQPSEGYAYAPLKDTELKISMDELTPEDIDGFIDQHFDELSKAGNHLGVWTQDGDAYIDVSRVGVPSAKTIATAQAADQLAVFDLKSFDEINIGEIRAGRYGKLDEATNLHNQHQRKVEAAAES